MAFLSPFYRWRPHPWHGLETGPEPPRLVHAYKVIQTAMHDYEKEYGE